MWVKSYIILRVRETCGGVERGLVVWLRLERVPGGVVFELDETVGFSQWRKHKRHRNLWNCKILSWVSLYFWLSLLILFFFFFFFLQSTHSQDSIQYISVLNTIDVALPLLSSGTSHSIQCLSNQGDFPLIWESLLWAVSLSSNLCAKVQASILNGCLTCTRLLLEYPRGFSKPTCPKWNAFLFWRHKLEVEISSDWQSREISLRELQYCETWQTDLAVGGSGVCAGEDLDKGEQILCLCKDLKTGKN